MTGAVPQERRADGMTRPTVADRKYDGPGRSGCCRHCSSCDGILLVFHSQPCAICAGPDCDDCDDAPIVPVVVVAGLVAR